MVPVSRTDPRAVSPDQNGHAIVGCQVRLTISPEVMAKANAAKAGRVSAFREKLAELTKGHGPK